MSIVHFKYLRKDAEQILLKVDQATKGKIDILAIRKLYFELGHMTGRVEERVKDLVKASTKKEDYIYLLNELKKRRFKLEDIMEWYTEKKVAVQNTTIIMRYSTQQEINKNPTKV